MPPVTRVTGYSYLNTGSRLKLFYRLLLLPPLLVGCGESGGLTEVSDVRLTLTPGELIELPVGDTVRLVAEVRNSADQGVHFESDAPGVAEVDGSGLVTARAQGLANITATAVADAEARASVPIRVVRGLPGGAGTPAVLIGGLLRADGSTADPQRLRGVLVAELFFRPAGAKRLQLLVNDAVVCDLEVSDSQAAADCEFDSAAYDAATGEPELPNGPATLEARLLRSDGAVAATAETGGLRLANINRLITTLEAERTATDSAGAVWTGGALTLQVLPVMYDTAAHVESVTARYRVLGAGDWSATDGTRPFTLVIPADSLLAGRVDPELAIEVTSVLETGASGPDRVTDPVAYDAAPPAPGALGTREWVGSGFEFRTLYDPAGASDLGVGRVEVEFYAGPAGESAEAVVAAGDRVADASELAESTAGAYRLAARVCDLLENCAIIGGGEFGVDLTGPRIEGTEIADRAVNPARDMSLVIADARSGVPARPIIAEVEAVRPGGEVLCGPVVENVDLPGHLEGGACVPDTLGGAVLVPRSTTGYYTYSLTALDRAGNRSEPVTRRILVDTVAPTITSVTLPAAWTPAEALVVAVGGADNLDLADAALSLVYPRQDGSRLIVPFQAPLQLGEPFDGALVPTVSADLQVPFIPTLTAPGAPGSRSTVALEALELRLTDAAGNATLERAAVPTDVRGSISTTEPFPAVETIDLAVAPASLCTRACLPTDATETTLAFRAAGRTGLSSPLERAFFFLIAPDGATTLVGIDEVPRVTDVPGVGRTFEYSVDLAAPAGISGDYTVFGIGVSARGSGLLSPTRTLQFFRR